MVKFILVFTHAYQSVLSWALFALWLLGEWQDVNDTTVVAAGIRIQLQSVAFSALITMALFFTKYTFVLLASMLRNRHSRHATLILKIPLSFEAIKVHPGEPSSA